jgi:hypothetical protein
VKWTRSDDQGHFVIRDLDPLLKFRVLVTAPNKKAHLTRLIDPLLGEVKATLQALPAGLPPERMLLGQVVDDNGQAVAEALLEPLGAQTVDRRWWGQVKGVDPTVSDAEGHFTLVLPEGFLGVDVQAIAQGYSGASLALLKPGPQRHRIVVPAGTRVTGRLVQDGKPVSGLRIAVVQLERAAGHHFIKAVGAVTDKDGKFVFDHLPASEDYAIFTVVEEGPQKLVLTTKRFKAVEDRQERNVGDLAVVAPKRVVGRVEGDPGQTLPAETRVMLGRDPVWDLIAVPLDKDGRFVIEGLPPETYEVEVVAKGFEIDGTRIPYQMLGKQSFGLRLRESIEDLRIPLVRSQPSNAR